MVKVGNLHATQHPMWAASSQVSQPSRIRRPSCPPSETKTLLRRCYAVSPCQLAVLVIFSQRLETSGLATRRRHPFPGKPWGTNYDKLPAITLFGNASQPTRPQPQSNSMHAPWQA